MSRSPITNHLLNHNTRQVSKYNYITVRPKASWDGILCHTDQHYHSQWLQISTRKSPKQNVTSIHSNMSNTVTCMSQVVDHEEQGKM